LIAFQLLSNTTVPMTTKKQSGVEQISTRSPKAKCQLDDHTQSLDLLFDSATYAPRNASYLVHMQSQSWET